MSTRTGGSSVGADRAGGDRVGGSSACAGRAGRGRVGGSGVDGSGARASGVGRSGVGAGRVGGSRADGARAAVHRAAPGRLGDAHPRQEGPADLRLVPPALAAWGTAALVLSTPVSWTVLTGAAATAAAVVLLSPSAARLLPTRGSGCRGGADRTGADRREGGAGDATGRGGPLRALRRGRLPVAAVLLSVAAAALCAGLYGMDLHRGPVPALAQRYASVTADLVVTSDPRRTRPRVTGDHRAPTAVLVDAKVVRVTTPDGAIRTTRTPVLVIADPSSGSRPRAAGTQRAVPAWPELLPGTRLRLQTARLAPPLPGGKSGIAAVVRVPGGSPPTVLKGPSAPQRLAGRLRGGLRTATRGLPPDARALLPGLVVGDTSRVPPELDAAFRATDLTHVLAVSGANVTLLLTLLTGPPGLAHRAERRGLAALMGIGLRGTALLGAALVLGFVVVCRPEPSVLRAAACGGIVLLALATGRRRSLLPALAAVVLLLVLCSPWLAVSYGFLLSVLATAALLTLAPRWSAALRARGLPFRAAEALAAAAAAQVVCAPVVVVLAARVSLVAVPCNLLAELVVGPAMVLGFVALLVAPVAMPAAEAVAWCAGWPAGWLAAIARTGAALPGSAVDWPGGWAGALLLAVVTAVLVVTGRRLLRHPWVCLVCVGGLLLFVLQPGPLPRVLTGWPPPGWRFAMCDVGQGDAAVLAVGDGSGVVVDTGPDPDRADRCLRRLGITRIPLLLLTHFHADHVAGLAGVLRGRQVGVIETTGYRQPLAEAVSVRALAAARHIPVTRATAGERRRAGALEWRVLWPPPGPWPEPDGPNDASVVLLVRTGGLRLLLLGDLEPAAQQALLRSPAGAQLARVDVMKVAHHGSAYQDPGLLQRAAPRLALISVGAQNPYGHPAARTIRALQSVGTRVLRTDRDGALAVLGPADRLRAVGSAGGGGVW